MVPLKDENPVKITPYVTYILIALNVLAFIYELSLNPQQLNTFFHLFAIVPLELSASFQGISVNQSVPEVATLITSQFLHAGFMHIIFNMLFLGIFGNNIEEQLGRAKYLFFYLACGVLAGLSQWFFAATSEIPSLGASGAIAGVMGAYIFKFPQAKIQQAFNGLASFEVQINVGMESGGVAYWAHAGGFVFGAILGWMLGLFAKDETEIEDSESIS